MENLKCLKVKEKSKLLIPKGEEECSCVLEDVM